MSVKTDKYYSLVVKENGVFALQFGDYNKQVVIDEREDSYEGCKTKIICTKPDQASIDAAIKELNK